MARMNVQSIRASHGYESFTIYRCPFRQCRHEQTSLQNLEYVSFDCQKRNRVLIYSRLHMQKVHQVQTGGLPQYSNNRAFADAPSPTSRTQVSDSVHQNHDFSVTRSCPQHLRPKFKNARFHPPQHSKDYTSPYQDQPDIYLMIPFEDSTNSAQTPLLLTTVPSSKQIRPQKISKKSIKVSSPLHWVDVAEMLMMSL